LFRNVSAERRAGRAAALIMLAIQELPKLQLEFLRSLLLLKERLGC
jgi:hypothetical protein